MEYTKAHILQKLKLLRASYERELVDEARQLPVLEGHRRDEVMAKTRAWNLALSMLCDVIQDVEEDQE